MTTNILKLGDHVRVILPENRPTFGKTGTIHSYSHVDNVVLVKLDKRFKTRKHYMFNLKELELVNDL
jgi:hypothetical protein